MNRGRRALLLFVFLAACSDPTTVEVFEANGRSGEPAFHFPDVPGTCQFPTQLPDPVVVMATPAANQEQALTAHAPIFERLSRKTGLHFDLQVPQTYAELEQALLSGKAHLAIASPLNYVQVKLKDPCSQLLLTSVSAGFAHYSAYFLVRVDAPYSDLEDLRGARLALLGPESASGSLYPLAYFSRLGIDPDSFFGSVTHFPNHLAALHALQDSQVDLVPTYSGIFAPARRDGIQMNTLRVFSVLERIPNDALVASRFFPREAALEVASALYELNPEFIAISRGMGSDIDLNGWVQTKESLYNPIRLLLGVEGLP